MHTKLQIKLFFSWLMSVLALAVSFNSQAAELALSSSPLYLGTQIDPNIFFMMDDSGSMDWETLMKDYQYYNNYWIDLGATVRADITNAFLRSISVVGASGCTSTSARNFGYIFHNTDNVYGCPGVQDVERNIEAAQRDWRVYSSGINVTYYDPSATYLPWAGYANADFTAARSNPAVDTPGYALTKNLAGFQYHVWIDDKGYTGTHARFRFNITNTPNGRVDLYDSRTRYMVNASDITVNAYTTGTAGAIITLNTDCTLAMAQAAVPYSACHGTTAVDSTITAAQTDVWGRTPAQVRQNVANWYQYHRKRSMVAKAAVARVITSYPDFRYGYSQINNNVPSLGGVFQPVPALGVTDYAAHNTALLNAMNAFLLRGQGTPLQRGLEVVGRYYSRFDNTYPDPIVSACQQNYSVLFTDGYWNGDAPYTAAIADNDGDGYQDLVADVAKYYYDLDLSPLPNQVPTSVLDPNNKQHMVTFTVAFGIDGFLVDTDNDKWPNPVLAGNQVWGGNTATSDKAKVDDLWHAAFNSKGSYASARSSVDVANAISNALLDIAVRVGASASVATNTGSLNAGSFLFQARFDSSDWRGQLLAFRVNGDGSIQPTPTWDAGAVLNTQNFNSGRQMITWNSVAARGVPFRFPANYKSPNASTEMTTAQINFLLTRSPFPAATVVPAEITSNQTYGNAITNYFRGDSANAGQGLNFRSRFNKLGDIVNSDPRYVGRPAFNYLVSMEAKSYAAFVTQWASRASVVYVGANDGFMHGFSETNGSEVLAYMPSAVYRTIWELATPEYTHRYAVDGGANIVDVYLPNKPDPGNVNGLWRTVLAGGLGAGGQGIYALDVTDPTRFTEANANTVVLWEFTHSNDADLGFTFGKPQMAKMANGKWAAVFGNGYNNTAADGVASATGFGVIYVVDVETGAIIKKFNTLRGSVETPNGVSTPLLVDFNGDLVVDYIYAGDIQGNMWKMNVTGANPASWDFHAQLSGGPRPLFTTEANQPITSQPQAALHPDNHGGVMIYFGTGKYMEVNDNQSFGQSTQAFYGIWDKNLGSFTPFTSANLLVQAISNQFAQAFDTDADGVNDTTNTLRTLSRNAINWSTHLGWKIDLRPVNVEGVANANNFGERQVSNAIVRNGRVIFTTLTPSQAECDFGGSSYLMQLDFRTGGGLGVPAFDLNKDGRYDGTDTNASGRASNVGIMPTVSLLSNGAQDVVFGSGASGDIDIIRLNVGSEAYGRQSWRLLE